MPNLTFTIGSKISACFLHDSFEIASKYGNPALFSMQKPGNLPQNLVCIALNNSKSRMAEKCTDLGGCYKMLRSWAPRYCAVPHRYPWRVHQRKLKAYKSLDDYVQLLYKQLGRHLFHPWSYQRIQCAEGSSKIKPISHQPISGLLGRLVYETHYILSVPGLTPCRPSIVINTCWYTNKELCSIVFLVVWICLNPCFG